MVLKEIEKHKNQIKLYYILKMLTVLEILITILVKELFIFIKLLQKSKEANLELFGEESQELMVIKELLLLDSNLIYQLEQWDQL